MTRSEGDKTVYMAMSRDQNAGRSHNIKINNKFFDRVGQLNYPVTILKIKIPFMKELRADVRADISGNVGCHSVQGVRE